MASSINIVFLIEVTEYRNTELSQSSELYRITDGESGVVFHFIYESDQ